MLQEHASAAFRRGVWCRGEGAPPPRARAGPRKSYSEGPREAARAAASRQALDDVNPAAARHEVAKGIDGRSEGNILEALLLLTPAQPSKVAC